MKQELFQIALVVADYDEALAFYTGKLGFTLVEDTVLSSTKRWVVIAPPGSSGAHLLLAKAATDEQKTRVGNQTGGRVFLFLQTDDFDRDYQRLLLHQVNIISPPAIEEYGKVTVFEDLYGNRWDLIGPA